mmetsp:Transcript_101527/g.315776  ORF Transcript_101527/g.315776 Transcript_101527/m.315776 type:complete len:257 (+) Transcript_101527:126-896(+)
MPGPLGAQRPRTGSELPEAEAAAIAPIAPPRARPAPGSRPPPQAAPPSPSFFSAGTLAEPAAPCVAWEASKSKPKPKTSGCDMAIKAPEPAAGGASSLRLAGLASECAAEGAAGTGAACEASKSLPKPKTSGWDMPIRASRGSTDGRADAGGVGGGGMDAASLRPAALTPAVTAAAAGAGADWEASKSEPKPKTSGWDMAMKASCVVAGGRSAGGGGMDAASSWPATPAPTLAADVAGAGAAWEASKSEPKSKTSG